MSERIHKYLILGAGPTGFGAAYRLRELGMNDFLIIEKSGHPGGLASSHTDEKGFVWDTGGHVHFSHYRAYDEAVDNVLGRDAFFHHVRNSQVWLRDRFIPYPFQNNIHYLPLIKRWSCLWGLIQSAFFRRWKRPPTNFYQWACQTFGSGIMREFFQPYNEKVWAHRLDQLDIGWMGERVPSIRAWPVVKNTLFKIDQKSWGPNNMFRFPKRGGTGAIWTAMAKHIGLSHIRLNADVVRVQTSTKTVQLEKGEKFSYERLISSIPLRVLGRVTEGLSSQAAEASQRLLYSTSHFVGIGLEGKPPAFIEKIGWMYFPEKDIPYYRATILSNYSPHVVPEPGQQWSLLLEMSESPDINAGFSQALEKTIEALLRTRFVADEKDIVSKWTFKTTFGYPTPHVGRDQLLNVIQTELEALHVYSRGRFGGWKYEASNQDHSFMQGVEIINRLEQGTPEVTYPTPDIANRGMR